MLSQVVREHQQAQAQSKRETERLRVEAVGAARRVADDLVEALNYGVSDVFQTQRKLEGEVKTLQASLGRFTKLSTQWISMIDAFNQSLKNIMAVLEKFTKAFEQLKAARTLEYKHHLGLVDLDIELATRKLSVSVSPLLATIILHFEQTSHWKLQELSSAMQVPAGPLRKRLAYWINLGVIEEVGPNEFALNEGADAVEQVHAVEELDEEGPALASASDAAEAELMTVGPFALGLLRSRDEAMSLSQIYQSLRMIFSMPSFTEAALKRILDAKVAEEELTFADGMYR